MNNPENKIPHGPYCYKIKNVNSKSEIIKTKLCPYWRSIENRPEQMNGYCIFLGCGDWEDGSDLWDQVKCCGINVE